MRKNLFFLLALYSLMTVSQVIRQSSPAVDNEDHGPLIYPGLSEDDESTITWDGKKIVFPLLFEQDKADAPVPRIKNDDGTLTDIMGILKVKMDCGFPWEKMVIASVDDNMETTDDDNTEEDEEKAMDAMPISGNFCYSTDSMTLTCLDSSYVVTLTKYDDHMTIPLPPGKYDHLRITFLNADGDEIESRDVKDVNIACGKTTEIEACPGKHFCTNRTKILSFMVDGSDKDDVVTYNPHQVNANVGFDENLQKIRHLTVTTFNRIKHGPMPQTISYTKKTGDTDIYGRTNVRFDDIELFPGRNKFHVNGIAKNVCNRAQFVSYEPRVIRLFLHTYSASFDYTDFGRKDSLSGYIPDWDYEHWGFPPSTIKWEFEPNETNPSEIQPKGDVAPLGGRYHDKHFTFPLSNLFWSAISYQREGFCMVRKGIVSYYAATIYYTYPSETRTHYEWAEKPARFTTDIIGGLHSKKPQADKSYLFEGYFKTQHIKSIDKKIKFSHKMFDGCERGFIIIPKSSYHGQNNMPHDINQYKYRSNVTEGEKFICKIKLPSHSNEFLCWVYLKVGNLLFLSRTKAMEAGDDTIEGGIFCDIPNRLAPHTKQLIELADKWVDIYEQCDKKRMRDDTLNKQKDEAMINLYNAYLECDKLYENTAGKPKGYVTKLPCRDTIPYTVEKGLPYEVVSPVKLEAVFFPPRLKAFEELFKSEEKHHYMKLTMTFETSPDLAIIAKQFPLFLTAIASVTIRLNSKLAPDELFKVKAYVPGDGPDGLQLGVVKEDYLMGGWDMSMNATFLNCIPGISYRQPEKAGDITIYFFINGWGTPSMLNNMKEIVFTNKNLKKKDIYVWSGKGFPQNPNVDWMLPWYEKVKKDYLAE